MDADAVRLSAERQQTVDLSALEIAVKHDPSLQDDAVRVGA